MNDGVDAFERELRRLVRLGDGPGKADKRAAAGAVAHDAALAEEIAKVRRRTRARRRARREARASRRIDAAPTRALPTPVGRRGLQGADSLAKDLADSHEVPGDKLYLYALRNVFAIGAQLQDAVEAELVRAARVTARGRPRSCTCL